MTPAAGHPGDECLLIAGGTAGYFVEFEAAASAAIRA